MVRKIAMRITATLAAVILLVGGTSTPALAASMHGCGSDLCLWDWVNWTYAGGRWGVNLSLIDAQPDDCLTLPDANAHFHTGQSVDNAAGSMAFDGSGGSDDLVVFYRLGNCNGFSGAFAIDADVLMDENDLHTSGYGNYGNEITSIRLNKGGQPPS